MAPWGVVMGGGGGGAGEVEGRGVPLMPLPWARQLFVWPSRSLVQT